MLKARQSRRGTSRRTFLFGALAAPALAPTVARAQPAPDRVRLGIIGVGGRGQGNWSALLSQDIRVWCDVDLARVAPGTAAVPQADVVQDFRRVLDRNDLDAVVVSTPDHWHAIPAVWAMATGRHVYCEKPLARSLRECRAMERAARKYRRVTQMGTQIHAGQNYRRVVELIQSGAIGKVREVDVWCAKPPGKGRLGPGTAPPETLDYDLWVGPADYRPYDPDVTPHHWRWWWDFAGGILADMGCHYLDLPHWALDLGVPTKVDAEGAPHADADNKVPAEMKVRFSHPARSGRPAVRVTWWHGIPGPRDADGRVVATGFSSGVLFHGDQGQLLADYSRRRLLPEERFRDFAPPPPSIPDSAGHHAEWISAIRGEGPPPLCRFEYGALLTETVLLGNLAYRLGSAVEWDSDSLRVKNVSRAAAEPLIRPGYRGGWKLPVEA